jgi:RNA polymerase sigma factor (sigma-70 family)
VKDNRTDAELIESLRAGDTAAFDVLWKRHSEAGLRYARRVLPRQAEDLVAESFLAIYRQVTATPKGPRFAFRSYLKAVIRNTAIRWSKDTDHLVDREDVDHIEPRDGLTWVEQDSESAEVLAAFQELPERWQRVLWLTEVAETPRPEIARELGMKPNAVSALHRRARAGLKLHWLNRQVPDALRDDDAHVAGLLPQYLIELENETLAAIVTTHVSACVVCADLLHGMRTASDRVQTRTLAVLLGAGGLSASATAATLSSGTTAVASGFFGIGLAGLLTTGALTVAAVGGGALLTALIDATPTAPAPAAIAAPRTAATAPPDAAVAQQPVASGPSSSPLAPESPAAVAPIGRHVDDPTIPTIMLGDPADQDAPTAPTRPQPADPSVPSPASGPDSSLSPGLTTPTVSTGYLAPLLTGKTQPGTSIAVAVDGSRFTPAVAADGSWSFDSRTLQLTAGTHDYQAWAFDASTQSAASTGTFTVLPLVVTGFEGLTGFDDMTVDEARTTGLVIAFTGPAGGRVYISTIEGHTAIVPLDDTGHTRLRLLMNSHGWYYFTFRALDADGFWGPGLEAGADVYDPDIIFDPYGPDPEDMTFTLTAP